MGIRGTLVLGGAAVLFFAAHQAATSGGQQYSSAAANRTLGDRLAAQEYGWTGRQATCLDDLWTGESGWRNHADTRVTGLAPPHAVKFAYGIPQAYPATKLPPAGRPASLGGKSSPRAQIIWGLGYIHSAYGSPCAALAAKRASGNKGY